MLCGRHLLVTAGVCEGSRGGRETARDGGLGRVLGLDLMGRG